MSLGRRWERVDAGSFSNRWVLWFVGLAVVGCAAAQPPGGPSAPRVVDRGPSVVRTAPSSSASLDGAFREGIRTMDQGQLETAQGIFEKLVVADSSRIEFHNALGIVYKRRGQLDKAISEYTLAITLSQKAPPVPTVRSGTFDLYNNLGIAYREKGEFKKAEEAYRKSIELNPSFSPAYYNLGVLYDLYFNRPSDALRNYREYEKLTGQNQTVEVWIQDLEQRTGTGRANGVGQP